LEIADVNVLVGYASAYGSTKGIAREIGDRLIHAGLHADVRTVDEIDAVDAYDAVVLGSAIHNMAWLPEAAAFMRSHAPALVGLPVWLFSVSSVGDTSSFFNAKVARFMRRMHKEPKEIAGYRQTIRVREHRSFAGAVERMHWNLGGHLFLKTFGGNYGDHRDWSDIDTWADRIAEQLQAIPNEASA
jgi:menaquinone-dependent protoporphyrinogen oxidase